MNYAPIILDIIMLLICLIIIIKSYQKGFVNNILTILGYIIAVIVAFYFNNICAEFIYERFLQRTIVDSVQKLIDSQNTAILSTAELIGAVLLKLPSFITANSINNTGSEENLIDLVLSENGDIVEDLSYTINDIVVAPIVIAILRIIFFLLIFVICVIIIKLAENLFKGVNHIPLIGTLNKLLGGVVGIVKAIIIVFLIAHIISLAIILWGDKVEWLNKTLLESSFFFKHISVQQII